MKQNETIAKILTDLNSLDIDYTIQSVNDGSMIIRVETLAPDKRDNLHDIIKSVDYDRIPF